MRVLSMAALVSLLALVQGGGPRDLVIAGGTVVVEPGSAPVRDGIVILRGSTIVAVGSRSAVRVPSGAQVLDASEHVVTAGYWNSHVHIFTPGLLHATDAPPAELQSELQDMFNRWGFTTVFDVASILGNTQALQRRISAGELRGPRILTVGEPLWVKPPVYVRDYLEAAHITIPPVTAPADAVARVRGQADRGADGIKLFTGSVQSDGVAHLALDIARAAVAEAHRRLLPVFAHPQDDNGLEIAIQAGVDVLTHPALDAADWTPAFVERLTRGRIALTPTLTLFDFEARSAGLPDGRRQAWIDKIVGELRAFRAGGGEILFGTDVGYTSHLDTQMEFELMAAAGLDADAILASLTTTPAARFGRGRTSGRLKQGYDADVVILEGNPYDDIRQFARVRATIRAGTITYERP